MTIEWISEVLNNLSKIGRTPENGSNRLGFTESDIEARRYFISLIEETGLSWRTDNFGNIIARLECGDKDSPAVATGSHIDTVPNGGHYDGILGSVLSLAAIKKIKEENTPLQHPIELIIFQLEESSRFGHATMGSKVMAGRDVLNIWKNCKDKDGKHLADVLKDAGFSFQDLPKSKRDNHEFAAFIELHIDQSTDLEYANAPIGIVEAIAAPIRSKVTIHGEAAHSGSTKIKFRKDALVSAAELVLAIRSFAQVYAEKKIVATVGNLKVFPGAMNVVPALAELYVDLRGVNKDVMDEVYTLIKLETSKIAQRHNTPIDIELLSEETPVMMDKRIYSAIKTICKEQTIHHENVISGAGHDAMNMASLTPTGMIFVKSKSGISHHPDEFASKEDINVGFKVLVEILKKLAS